MMGYLRESIASRAMSPQTTSYEVGCEGAKCTVNSTP
jgi:hypothetical protein